MRKTIEYSKIKRRFYHEEKIFSNRYSSTYRNNRICSNCNTPATENDVFCRKCGAKLEELPKKQAQTQEGENAEQPSAEQAAEEQQEQNDAKTE